MNLAYRGYLLYKVKITRKTYIGTAIVKTIYAINGL